MWHKEDELRSGNSLLSTTESTGDMRWDTSTDKEEEAKWRGSVVLGIFLLCIALFFGGLAFPLVEVVIFPGSPDMEIRTVKSVVNMILLAFTNGQVMVGIIMLLCTVGIPMVLFVGMLGIMHENFFAIGFGWSALFRPSVRALMMSFMYISTSYQVVMIFLIMLFTCFFTGFDSDVHIRMGFHFLTAYCMLSIALIQAMEFLRVDTEKDDSNGGIESGVGGEGVESLTGYNLRRTFSSFFPSLPGIKETTNVDTFQVFFFQLLFLVLLVMGFSQPLLDVRVMYQGVALERTILSLRDIVSKLAGAAPLVMLLFVMLVVVIPVLYGCVLVAAGILDVYFRCSGVPQGTIIDGILLVAKILRPWVMIDVFSIALIIVLYAVQNDYVSATIPDGMVELGPNGMPVASFGATAKQEHWLHFFSGMYLIVGAGIATIFLRWFWSSSAGVYRKQSKSKIAEMKRFELYHHVPMVSQPGSSRSSRSSSFSDNNPSLEEEYALEESIATRYVAGKSCRCLVVWTAICLLLHGLHPSQQNFQLSSMNQALASSLPLLNKLLAQYAPETVGNCKYPATGIPQPCYEYGILAKKISGQYRVTGEWMTGMKTLRFSNVSISRTQTLSMRNTSAWQPGSPVQASPTIAHRFVLDVKGVIADPKLFLKIEECPKSTQTFEAITGKGLCKPFLDTADSCCEPDRTFDIQLAMECHLGDSSLGNFQIQGMRMDTMTVRPQMWKGQVQLLIADKNITSMVLASVKDNIMWYLTQATLLKIGGEEINIVDFLNRVLRFNAPHEEFHCR